MSASMFRWTEECEQDPMCVGDCDLCRKETMIDKYDEVGIPALEVEADGFITRPEALEKVSAGRAKPMAECPYPRCEECDKYHGHYCTVPMVVSKQIWRQTAERIGKLEKSLAELEALVTDEIIGSHKHPRNTADKTNYTWKDYFDREDKTDEILDV